MGFKLKILLILLIIFTINLVALVNAGDNIKSYDEATKTVTIKDPNLNTIAEIQLLTEKHRIVFPESHAAEIRIKTYEPISDFISKMEFHHKDSLYAENLGDEINGKSFTYKYYDPNFEWSEQVSYLDCDGTNTTCETKYRTIPYKGKWLDFDTSKELPVGEIKIRMYYPNLEEGEVIEWIPTLLNTRIEEWADFTGASLYERYNLDKELWEYATLNPSWPTICQLFKVGATWTNESHLLKGISVNVSSGGGITPHVYIANVGDNNIPSTNISVNTTTTIAQFTHGYEWTNISMPSTTLSAGIRYALCISHGANAINWKLNYSNTGNLTAMFGNGDTPYMRVNADGVWSPYEDGTNFGIIGFEVWGIPVVENEPPLVNLKAPADDAIFTPGSIEFIYTVSDPDVNDSISNCSLWLNNALDQTDDTIIQIINQSFFKTLEIGNYTWEVSCYDNRSLQGNSTVYNLSITGVNVPPTIDIPLISPDPAYTNSTLNCSTIAYDQNLDALTIEFYWYNNSVLTFIQNKSSTNGTLASSLLTSGLQAKGETWNCTVRAFDGQNYSDYSSTTKTILNSVPTHTTPLLNASTIYNTTSDDLTCYNKSTYDADNDKVTNIYSWFINNTPFAKLYLPFEINVNDYSGNNNHAVNYGATYTTGKLGNALSFDGNDYIEIPDSNTLDFTDKKTWELWFKRSSTNDEILFNKGNATHTNYKLEFVSNKLKFLYSLLPGLAGYSWTLNNQADFDQGIYTQTYYNTTYNAVMLNAYTGNYKSKIFNDSEKALSFNTISFSADVPKFEELIVEEGMVGLWHLNENSGNATSDETSNNNDGTIYGATWTLGKFNSALKFDGNNDYVSTSTANFPTGNGNITIEAWFKIDELDSDNCIVTYGSNSGNNAVQVVHRTSDDKLVFHYWGGYGAVTTSLNDNNWHHAAAVHANNTNYLYLDGVLKGSTSYTNANLINNFNNIGRVVGFSSYDFNGTIDEVSIYNRSLSASEILEHYNKGLGALTNLSLSVRSCAQDDCSDKGSNWDITDIIGTYDISSLTDNKYVQFKADFSTNNTDYSPKLYNVELNYSAQVAGTESSLTSTTSITDANWHFVAVAFDDNISENNFKLYLDNSLEVQKTEHDLPVYKQNDLEIGKWFNGSLDEIGIYDRALSSDEISEHFNLNYNKIISDETSINDVWKCKVTPNDGIVDGNTSESNAILIMPDVYNITFNITEGEYGNPLTNVMIACSNGWGISNTPTNPYTHTFYEGSYICEFEKLEPKQYYNKTTTFTADTNKQIDIIMSLKFHLTIEEHNWLEAIYSCLYEGNCKTLDLLEQINETTTNIWDQFKPTDASVILFENTTSRTLSSTQNISIKYSLKVPPKAGYSDGDYLPIRIAYWFLDTNNQSCLDQDKTTSNRAEHPYCIPLIAETLGKINQITNFTVDLRPNLPAGTYNIIRDIEIDPNQIWIKYGQGIIGTITVLENNENPIITLFKQVTSAQDGGSGADGGSSGSSDKTKEKEIIRERIIEREVIKPSIEYPTTGDSTRDTIQDTITTSLFATVFSILLTIVITLGILWAVIRNQRNKFYY